MVFQYFVGIIFISLPRRVNNTLRIVDKGKLNDKKRRGSS